MLHTAFDTEGRTNITRLNEHCLELPAPLLGLPPWDPPLLQRRLRELYPKLHTYLDLGRFHSLLPPEVAYENVMAQCDLLEFEQLYRTARLVIPTVGLRTELMQLL